MSAALLAGIVRVAFFFAGFLIGLHQKRVTVALAFGLASTSSTVFLFSNSGIPVSHYFFDYAVLVSTPIAALLMLIAIFGCRKVGGKREEWTLW